MEKLFPIHGVVKVLNYSLHNRDYSHRRLRIPHFRRIKIPQFSILEKGSRIVSNAENGGMAIDTRFVFARLEH